MGRWLSPPPQAAFVCHEYIILIPKNVWQHHFLSSYMFRQQCKSEILINAVTANHHIALNKLLCTIQNCTPQFLIWLSDIQAAQETLYLPRSWCLMVHKVSRCYSFFWCWKFFSQYKVLIDKLTQITLDCFCQVIVVGHVLEENNTPSCDTMVSFSECIINCTYLVNIWLWVPANFLTSSKWSMTVPTSCSGAELLGHKPSEVHKVQTRRVLPAAHSEHHGCGRLTPWTQSPGTSEFSLWQISHILDSERLWANAMSHFSAPCTTVLTITIYPCAIASVVSPV